MNRTLTYFCLRCLAHPVSNVQMILLSLPLMMPWVSRNLQPLALIRYPNKMLCFMLEGIFARNILRKTVVKSVQPCTSSLTCSELSDLSDSSTTFLQQKSYNSVSSGKPGLTMPSAAFVFLKKCEVVCVSFHGHNVCQRLFSIILAGADLTFLAAGECRDNFTVQLQYISMWKW